MSGLYLHIPFCKQACHYCDFHFSTNISNRAEMLQALNQELELRKAYLGGDELKTIYFGGGTPSLLTAGELRQLLERIRLLFRTSAEAEVTVECNPDDLSPEHLQELFQTGVNRLSIGVQSFDDKTLTYFNRAHTASESLRCFANARLAGFTNISLDLIYGIPGQTNEMWVGEIRKACALGPEHISAYALTIEEKTVFGHQRAKGLLSPLPEEKVAEHFELLMAEMGDAGYDHYEISNFAKPGKYSRHNTSYWEQKHYLGIGPSAHSYNGETRQFNVPNNAVYIKSLREGKVPFEKEVLDRETLINEYIMTRLRTSYGLDLTQLKQAYGFDLLAVHSRYVESLISMGKVRVEGHNLRLSNQGKLLADKISADLFVSVE